MPEKYEKLITFVTNPTLLASIFSWLGAQFLKTIIHLIYGRIKTFKDLLANMFWRTGGMPSSHSAVVTAACTSIGIRDGVNSSIFMLSLLITFIKMRDAVGVRRSSGIQSKKLNELGRELEENNCIICVFSQISRSHMLVTSVDTRGHMQKQSVNSPTGQVS